MEWWLNHVGQMAQSVQDYSNSEKERIIIFVMESCDKMDWCNQDKYLYLRIPCYNCNTFRVDLT